MQSPCSRAASLGMRVNRWNRTLVAFGLDIHSRYFFVIFHMGVVALTIRNKAFFSRYILSGKGPLRYVMINRSAAQQSVDYGSLVNNYFQYICLSLQKSVWTFTLTDVW